MPHSVDKKGPYITIHGDVGILFFKDYFVASICLSMCTLSLLARLRYQTRVMFALEIKELSTTTLID